MKMQLLFAKKKRKNHSNCFLYRLGDRPEILWKDLLKWNGSEKP